MYCVLSITLTYKDKVHTFDKINILNVITLHHMGNCFSI